MPPPLTADGQVTYADGNPKPTVDQMAKDVSAFLVWTAEPELERRHAAGMAIVIFLLFATVLGYFAYRRSGPRRSARSRRSGRSIPANQAKRTPSAAGRKARRASDRQRRSTVDTAAVHRQ